MIDQDEGNHIKWKVNGKDPKECHEFKKPGLFRFYFL
jgi:hypothetical protein